MIRVDGLTKRYGGLVAVDGLTFDAKPGETFALVGPNGAGKTTTLKALLGLVRPDAGRIALGERGLPPHDPAARRSLGYVPQRTEFPPMRSVAEVLGFFADLRGLPARSVEAALDRVGMTPLAGRRAVELSGGYLQRLALAQALLGDPAVLVLDEPTASLDPEATFEFRTLVQRLQSDGKTILLCSHLLAEVERVADRVLILVAGRRAALESMRDLRARQATATKLVVDVGDRQAAARAVLSGRSFQCAPENGARLTVQAAEGRFIEALEALRAEGIPPGGFELVRPTLEEVFLDVVRRGGPA